MGFKLNEEQIKAGQEKLKQERPELFKRKKITGNQRNAFLREQLQTTAKVTGATMPVDPKQLAKDYPSPVLEEALRMRRKQEARDYAKTPRMRHFKRVGAKVERWSERWDGPLQGGTVGVIRHKPHVCIPECGMYCDKEAKAAGLPV